MWGGQREAGDGSAQKRVEGAHIQQLEGSKGARALQAISIVPDGLKQGPTAALGKNRE